MVEKYRRYLISQAEIIIELLKDDELFKSSQYGKDRWYNSPKRAELRNKLREFRRDSLRLVTMLYKVEKCN